MTETQRTTYRVKLYELDEGNNWTDKGTGFCYYITDETDELCVISEEDEKTELLCSTVNRSNIYQRQKDTLILWTEEGSRDMAISFQDAASCQHIWDSFSERGMVYAQNHLVGFDDDADKIMDEEFDSEVVTDNESTPKDILPEPTLSNLESTIQILENLQYMRDKEKIAKHILSEDYVEKLVPIFNECEDLEAYDEIFILYNLLLCILGLNNHSVIKHTVSKGLITFTMGVLEYNPKMPNQKTNHRAFINSKGSSKDHFVELQDEQLIKDIDTTFYLRYLHNILATHTSSNLLDTLNGMIQQNNILMIKDIQSDPAFLSHLCTTIVIDTKRREECLGFLLHLCELARDMQVMIRYGLYKALAQHGLIDVLSIALSSENHYIKKTSVHLLESLVQADVHIVRSQITAQENEDLSLMKVIVKEATAEDIHGFRIQYFHILKVLLELNAPNPGAPAGTEKDIKEFLSVLYDKDHMKSLFNIILSFDNQPIKLSGECTPLLLTRDENDLCKRLMDLLTFTFKTHTFQFKYFLLTNNLISKMLQLTRSDSTYIKLFPIRFVRTCLELKEEFYYTNFIKMNIFESILRVTVEHKEKDNLVSACCFSLFELVNTSNIEVIVKHLVSEFSPVLETIVFTKSTLLDKLKIDPSSPPSEESTNEKVDPNGGWTSSVDKEEEDYFNGSDDDEETQPTSPVADPPIDERTIADSTVDSTSVNETSSNEPTVNEPTVNEPTLNEPPAPELKRLRDAEDEDEEDTPFIKYVSNKKFKNKKSFKRLHNSEGASTNPHPEKRQK
ncbi:component of IIS longevity pathway SMK-1-domain-containing protein [Sporodiniella umbellata]|nr:component of IIS longevity pathway SMK-1-domain-containing protein [Sporodiniella umbellata]